MRFLFALLSLFAFAPGLYAQEAPAYVGSASCTACHTEETEHWQGSHHALAWTAPTPDNILADFDGTSFRLGEMEARFAIAEDGTYAVSVTETDGVTTNYKVHSVAGIAPLQQYLLETEPGHVQSFDVVWDTEQGGWFHLYPDQDLPPDDGLHWTGPYKNWNARCAECHATGFEKNYDATTRSYASTQTEIGVGCEACHGPGAEHLRWADGLEIAQSGADLDAYGFTMSFDDTEATIQQCATCHSRREAHGNGNPLPGTAFQDAYDIALLRPGLYHADGQILDEVYVYGSFLQSKMYSMGVGCLDCHDAHTAQVVAEGNAVCTQCHNPGGNPGFDSLRGAAYDTPEHHFHEMGTEGAQCVSCHMIERVYMGNDWRRDHSFRVPRPDLAAETGAPNACTDCHTGETADWAADQVAQWYPDSTHRGPHYGVTLARGRTDPVAAAGDLADLAEDATQSGLVRATALWLLEQSNSPATARRLEPLLADPDPIIRGAAAGMQRVADPQDRVLRLVGLLNDPVRSVRIAAVRELLDAPVARLPRAIEADRQAAMRDWQGTLANRLDFPETHLQLGGMALTSRNFRAAAAAFDEVLVLDPQRVEAWSIRVRIAAALDGAEAAREVLDRALARVPDDPQLQQIDAELRAAQQ